MFKYKTNSCKIPFTPFVPFITPPSTSSSIYSSSSSQSSLFSDIPEKLDTPEKINNLSPSSGVNDEIVISYDKLLNLCVDILKKEKEDYFLNSYKQFNKKIKIWSAILVKLIYILLLTLVNIFIIYLILLLLKDIILFDF